MTISQDFLSIKEFANLIHVHPNTVRRSIHSGRLQAFRVGEGKKAVYRIPLTEINRLSLMDLEKMIEVIVDQGSRQNRDREANCQHEWQEEDMRGFNQSLFFCKKCNKTYR